MDKLSVRQRKGFKSKKKPIKVVYISNPMKVKASVSDFRALVQELTGRDSELSDPTKLSDTNNSVDGVHHPSFPAHAMDAPHGHDLIQNQVPRVDPYHDRRLRVSDSYFEPLDDGVFTSQMIESSAGFFPSSL